MTNTANKTMENYFSKLAREAELSFAEYAAISRCQAQIECDLAAAFLSFTTILPGAFSRHTMVAPLGKNVVDMLVLFNQNYMSRALPAVFVRKLESCFCEKYPGSFYNSKTISIHVPVEDFWFRVQPGFISNESHYYIPSPMWDDWIEYNPLGYKQAFARNNGEHRGKLVHIVRLMKRWNRLSGEIFDGYYLELLVRDILYDYNIQSYSATLNYIFKVTMEDVVFKKDDPANTSIQVVGLSDVGNLIQAMKAVHAAYISSMCALDLENMGNTFAAIANWNKLFSADDSSRKLSL